MTLLIAESGVDEAQHELAGQRFSDDAPAQDEHVHVVVLDALVRRVGVVAKPGPDAAVFVGRDRRAHATSAHQDAALAATVYDRPRDDGGAVGIVDRLRRVRAEILDLMSVPDEPVTHDVLDRKTRVIGAYNHAHRHTPPAATLAALTVRT